MSPPILRGSVSRFIWSVVEVFSIVPVVLLQVYVPLMLGRIVVAERYVVDSIASIAYFLGDDSFTASWKARLLLKFVPKGTVFVYVDADYETVLARRGELAGPREYTDFHRRLYDRMANDVRAFRVNASKDSIREVHQKILNFALRQGVV